MVESRVQVEESAESGELELPKLIFVFESCRLVDAEGAKQKIEEWLADNGKRVLILEATAGPQPGWPAPRVVIHVVSPDQCVDVLRELPKVELRCHIEGGGTVVKPAVVE